MRRRLALCVIGLCSFLPGCQLVTSGTRNLVLETTECTDTVWSHLRTRRLADSAWKQVRETNPDRGASADYAAGFKDGFADYLDAGGTGEPPAVPPRCYWRSCYETPEGYQAIQDWFAGFRHGAAAARESGYRRFITLPLSSLDPEGTPPDCESFAQGHVPPGPGEPVLSAPRKVMPGAGEPPLKKTGPEPAASRKDTSDRVASRPTPKRPAAKQVGQAHAASHGPESENDEPAYFWAADQETLPPPLFTAKAQGQRTTLSKAGIGHGPGRLPTPGSPASRTVQRPMGPTPARTSTPVPPVPDAAGSEGQDPLGQEDIQLASYAEAARGEESGEEPSAPGGLKVTKVNSKRISLNFEVKDVGQSGLGGIELWYTQDGQTWMKHQAPPKSSPPYVIEVDKEDVYGFTLVGRNGVGLSKQPPQPGDRPQVWVEVDVTRPVMHLLSAEVGRGAEAEILSVQWSATDKNMAAFPITVSYAGQPEGPWVPLAAKIKNSGRYACPLPPEVPPRFYVRVAAVDQVGNVGTVQTPYPLVSDVSQPSIAIVGVTPADR